MAIAISGAVIVNNGIPFRYKKKCDFCGYVDVCKTTCSMPRKPVTMNTAFICPRCKKRVKVVIKGE